MPLSTAVEARTALAGRLQARRDEIEQATLARVYAIADPTEVVDYAYAEGLRAAVAAALDYGIAAIERAEEHAPPAPVWLLAQARMAARNGISLDTVLRRYFAGYALLGDFLTEEAEATGLSGSEALKRLQRAQACLFDRLLAIVSEEHARETANQQRSANRRLSDRIERLLAGEFIDTAELSYDFENWHVGVVAAGVGSGAAVRDLAHDLDCRTLVVGRHDGTVWAWLGARQQLEAGQIKKIASSVWPKQLALALGEPGQGIGGWRLTHRQASAAATVAQRGPVKLVRYADVALLASIARDDLLDRSLRELYIAPLSGGRDGGAVLLETLRAYFTAERNAASAAASLGVSRQAVNGRLRTAERLLGRPLGQCSTDLEVALCMQELASAAETTVGVT